jgi:hypothetical protein
VRGDRARTPALVSTSLPPPLLLPPSAGQARIFGDFRPYNLARLQGLPWYYAYYPLGVAMSPECHCLWTIPPKMVAIDFTTKRQTLHVAPTSSSPLTSSRSLEISIQRNLSFSSHLIAFFGDFHPTQRVLNVQPSVPNLAFSFVFSGHSSQR